MVATKGKAVVGATVNALFGSKDGGTQWFRGQVTAMNGNGTFDITYDDGDREMEIEARYVEGVSPGRDGERRKVQPRQEDEEPIPSFRF